MASKYAHVFAGLKKILNTDPKHQEKVNAVKSEMQAEPDFRMHASSLSAAYAAVRREKDAINEALSECQVRLDAIFQLMCDAYEIEGTTGLTLENGDKVRVQPKLYVGFPDPEAFRLWCLADPDLSRKMTLHSSTATSLVSKMLLDGLAAPPGAKASVVDQAVFKRGEE